MALLSGGFAEPLNLLILGHSKRGTIIDVQDRLHVLAPALLLGQGRYRAPQHWRLSLGRYAGDRGEREADTRSGTRS